MLNASMRARTGARRPPIVVYWRVASFRKRRVRSCGDRQLEKDVDNAIKWFEKNLERNPSQRAQAPNDSRDVSCRLRLVTLKRMKRAALPAKV